jgi:Flp pilus assembly pilin Flp
MSNIQRFLRDVRGGTSIEYAILVGMIALIVFAGVKAFGGALNTAITNQAAAIGGVNTSTH